MRALASALLGVTSTVTLMACYGIPAKDECRVPEGCAGDPCDRNEDCDLGQYCSEHPQGTPGTCQVSATCTTDAQCATGMRCDKDRTTCEPIPRVP